MTTIKLNKPRIAPHRQVLRCVLGSILPRRRYLAWGPTAGNTVALTFDDGPNPEYTPQLLDLLHVHRVRATFFVVGQQAERFPALIRRMADEGHEIGNHSWSHTNPRDLTLEQHREEICRTRDLVQSITGVTTRLFRPPYGQFRPFKIWQASQLDHTIVFWSVDPQDYRWKSEEELQDSIARGGLRAGDIILLHEVSPLVHPAVRNYIQRAAAAGLTFRTVSEAIRNCPPRRAA